MYKINLLLLLSVPVAAPEVISISFVDSYLSVEWKPLPAELARGLINEQKLFYRPVGSTDEAEEEIVDGDVYEHLIAGEWIQVLSQLTIWWLYIK